MTLDLRNKHILLNIKERAALRYNLGFRTWKIHDSFCLRICSLLIFTKALCLSSRCWDSLSPNLQKKKKNNVLQPISLSFHLPFTFKSMRVYLLLPHSVVFALRTDHLFSSLKHPVVLEGPGPLTTDMFSRVCWYWMVLEHSLLKCFHAPGLSDYLFIICSLSSCLLLCVFLKHAIPFPTPSLDFQEC